MNLAFLPVSFDGLSGHVVCGSLRNEKLVAKFHNTYRRRWGVSKTVGTGLVLAQTQESEVDKELC
jgi:hypothetical protein